MQQNIMTPEIVPPLAIEELTGYSRPAEQKDCLRRHGIYYIEGKDGRIRTTWYHVNHPSSQSSNNDGFDLDAIA